MASEECLPENVGASATTEIKEETFDFLWTVTNFSAVCVNEEIVSPTFYGGPKNSSWRLYVYPKNRVKGKNYFAIYLHRDFSFLPIKARYEFTILDENGKPEVSGACMDGRRFWLISYGGATFMPYAKLKDRDSIKIHCRVWITLDKKPTISEKCKGLPEDKDMNQRIKRPNTDFGKIFKDSVMNLVHIFKAKKM